MYLIYSVLLIREGWEKIIPKNKDSKKSHQIILRIATSLDNPNGILNEEVI